MFQGSFKVFQGSFDSISKSYKEFFKEVCRVFLFQRNWNGVSRKLYWVFKGILGKYNWCFNDVQDCLKEVPRLFQGRILHVGLKYV